MFSALKSSARWLLVLVAVLFGAHAVRADLMDIELANEAGDILAKLKDGGYKNVGVLHFRVQKEGSPNESFSAAPLSGNLATRLENALIIRNDPKDSPLGIIHDATSTALKNKVGGWYRAKDKDGARKKLFDINYPLAWGDKAINHADKSVKLVFLTGVVKVAKDLNNVTVVIETLTKDGKLNELTKFDVKMDESLLADLGQTVVIAHQRGQTSAQRTARAIADARKRDAGNNNDVSPANAKGIKIEVLFDGVAQEITKDSQSPGEWRLPPPRAGQKVSVRLTSVDKDRLAVVLKVNGNSTWKEQSMESKMCQMWVMHPDERQEYLGYYYELDGKNLVPFDVLDDKQSADRAAEFGDKVGLLTLDVFESGSKKEDAETMAISLRSVPHLPALRHRPAGLAGNAHPKKLEELQNQLMARSHIVWKKEKAGDRGIFGKSRGLIVPEKVDPVEGGKIGTEVFENPTQRIHFVIRYYDFDKLKISAN